MLNQSVILLLSALDNSKPNAIQKIYYFKYFNINILSIYLLLEIKVIQRVDRFS